MLTGKANFSGITDKRSKEASDQATHDLAILHEEITALPELPEVEWTRFRKLEFQELIRQRATLHDRLVKLDCQLNEDFDDHVSFPHTLMLTGLLMIVRHTARKEDDRSQSCIPQIGFVGSKPGTSA